VFVFVGVCVCARVLLWMLVEERCCMANNFVVETPFYLQSVYIHSAN
jgi:hypothetical protein